MASCVPCLVPGIPAGEAQSSSKDGAGDRAGVTEVRVRKAWLGAGPGNAWLLPTLPPSLTVNDDCFYEVAF